MKILGIDQSFTSTGICLIENGQLITAHKFKPDMTRNRFTQAHEITQHISQFITQFTPDIIAIEGLAFGMRGNVTRDLGGLQFVIISHVQEVLGYTVQIVAPTSAKKFATGSGRASKSEMIEMLPHCVREYFDDLGVKKTTGLSDLTDAYFIAMYALPPLRFPNAPSGL